MAENEELNHKKLLLSFECGAIAWEAIRCALRQTDGEPHVHRVSVHDGVSRGIYLSRKKGGREYVCNIILNRQTMELIVGEEREPKAPLAANIRYTQNEQDLCFVCEIETHPRQRDLPRFLQRVRKEALLKKRLMKDYPASKRFILTVEAIVHCFATG